MICTRSRPKMLRECLLSILFQVSQTACGDEIVVVENDDHPNCKGIIEELRAEYPDDSIIYKHEPDIGIPIARNRAVEIALTLDVDWLAFIDDDAIVKPGWLEAMRQAAQTFNAEALSGPVDYLISAERPIWMKPAKKKSRIRGQILDRVGTNNTMISAAWLKSAGTSLRFDEVLRYSGGEDSDFFIRFTDAGGRIAWVDDAVVSEHMIAERLTIVWQLKKAYSIAAINTYINYKNRSLLTATARSSLKASGRFIKGFVQCLIGCLMWLPNRSMGARLLFEGSKSLATASGIIQGLLGIKPQPYRVTTGY